MKRALLVLLAFALVACVGIAQEPVYYNSTPTLMWTPPPLAPDGSEFLPGDTVEYNIYAWDVGLLGFDPPPALGLMDLRATWIDVDPTTVAEEELLIDFSSRRNWGVALTGTHIDGGDNRTDYVGYLASSRAGDTASGVPFVYTPASGAATEPPGAGLRDSGM